MPGEVRTTPAEVDAEAILQPIIQAQLNYLREGNPETAATIQREMGVLAGEQAAFVDSLHSKRELTDEEAAALHGLFLSPRIKTT